MPSNPKYVCVPCRTVFKQTAVCPSCGGNMQYVGARWSPPKKNNDRAWKRIEKGEWLWDRRRVRRKNWGWLPTDAIGRNKQKQPRYRWTATWKQNSKNGAKVDLGG